MPLHSALTGSELHEPKGVAVATIDKVYVSNGAGSGSWQKIEADQIDTTSILNVNEFVLSGRIDDVSTGSSVYLNVPYACTINKIETVLHGAITVADATVELWRGIAGVFTSMGTFVVAFTGSAAGDIDALSPVTNNTYTTANLTSGSVIRVTTDGASSTAAALSFVIRGTKTNT